MRRHASPTARAIGTKPREPRQNLVCIPGQILHVHFRGRSLQRFANFEVLHYFRPMLSDGVQLFSTIKGN
jgi:hypothetical protein